MGEVWIDALEIRELGTDRLVHTVPINPPQPLDSNTIERVTYGILINLAEGMYVAERTVK